jgi:hypothetical protein
MHGAQHQQLLIATDEELKNLNRFSQYWIFWMDPADFPGETNPTNRRRAESGFPDNSGATETIDRNGLDNMIGALGGPIHKTVIWHMNKLGVLRDDDRIDMNLLYQHLRELFGPGADMIMNDLPQSNIFSASASPKIFINGNGRNDEPPSAAGCTNQPKSTGLPDKTKNKLFR